MLSCLRLFVLSAVASGAVASAQTTWIVDATGGPGSQFTEIQPAIDVASDGDTIEVRAGSYQPFTASLGVSVVGTAPGQVSVSGMSVTGLASGRTFAAAGLSTPNSYLAGNAGVVALDRIVGERMWIRDCQAVMVANSRFASVAQRPGARNTEVRDSVVTFTNCDVQGAPTPTSPLYAGLECRAGADVRIAGGTFVGGFGGSPAVHVEAMARCTVSHDTAVLQGGPWYGAPVFGYAADVELGGTLVLDPQVTLASSILPDPIEGDGSVEYRFVPSLLVEAQGVSIATDLYGGTGDAAALLIGFPGAPLSLPFGSFWLDPRVTVALYSGSGGPVGHVFLTVSLPASTPAGIGLALQGLVVENGVPELTNVALAITG